MRRIRHADLLPEERLEGRTVHVVGCGAIGSVAAVAVGKMAGEGIKLVLWDDDVVSLENLSVSFFRRKDVDRPKAEALAEIVEEFDGPKPEPRVRRVTAEDLLADIVLSCTDSLVARLETLEAALAGGARILVDARMGAEYIDVQEVPLCDAVRVKAYRATLAPGPVVQERCTAKSIVYTVFNAAGLMVAYLKAALVDQPRAFGSATLDLRNLIAVFPDPPEDGETTGGDACAAPSITESAPTEVVKRPMPASLPSGKGNGSGDAKAWVKSGPQSVPLRP